MRIMSDQPWLRFTRSKPVTVRRDKTVTGEDMGRYIYRQGEDYMIIKGLREATYLERMGFTVQYGYPRGEERS